MGAATIPRMSPNTSWIFPGQGSQSVGMGAAALAASPAARAVLAEAEAALGVPLGQLMAVLQQALLQGIPGGIIIEAATVGDREQGDGKTHDSFRALGAHCGRPSGGRRGEGGPSGCRLMPWA